jgi:non-specific serine/threonine protein kinase
VSDILLQYEASRLFVERAHAVSLNFAVTPTSAPALASICHRLDGIPLAIELAAARVRTLPVEEIHARLDHCFHLLTGGSRTALPRQQTLRALIDWSYDLLNDKEKTLLSRLSVFSGGWTLEAAEEVCRNVECRVWSVEEEGKREKGKGKSTIPNAQRPTPNASHSITPSLHHSTLHTLHSTSLGEDEILDLLTALADKSLVIYEEECAGPGRYRMLATVRQYAAEKLQDSREEADIRTQHTLFFLAFAEHAEPGLLRSDQSYWIERVEKEHDNLRVALEWCRRHTDTAEFGLRIAGAIWLFWFLRCFLNEGREQLSVALKAQGESGLTASRIKALVGEGALAYFQGDLTVAYTACQHCLDPSRQAGDYWSIGIAQVLLGVLANYEGNFETAKRYFEQCLSLAKQENDLWLQALALSDLGFVAFHQGEYPQAREFGVESLSLARQVGEKWCIFNSLYSLGLVTIVGGDFVQARDLFKEAMSISRGLGHSLSIALCMEGLAGAWGAQGEAEKAALLFGAAAARRDFIGAAVPSAFRFGYDRNLDAVRNALGEELFTSRWSEGQAMTFEQAIDYALSE